MNFEKRDFIDQVKSDYNEGDKLTPNTEISDIISNIEWFEEWDRIKLMVSLSLKLEELKTSKPEKLPEIEKHINSILNNWFEANLWNSMKNINDLDNFIKSIDLNSEDIQSIIAWKKEELEKDKPEKDKDFLTTVAYYIAPKYLAALEKRYR